MASVRRVCKKRLGDTKPAYFVRGSFKTTRVNQVMNREMAGSLFKIEGRLRGDSPVLAWDKKSRSHRPAR